MSSQENSTICPGFILVGFEDVHKFHGLIFAVLLCLYVITLVTNMLIIVIIKSNHIFNSPMYFFLMNLACLEVCYLTVIVPKLLESLVVKPTLISFVGCGIQMFFFLFFGVAECFLLAVMAVDRYIAICHPLHYSIIVNRKVCLKIVTCPYICGIIVGLVHTIATFSRPFCGMVIKHFFCEIQPLLELLCGDTFLNEVQVIGVAMLAVMVPFMLIVLSYIGIIYTIVWMSSMESKHKAFSTCSSHLIVVILFYGTVCSTYLKPKSSYSQGMDNILSFSYCVVTPLLNPIIYGLTNKEIRKKLRKLWHKSILL